jgi:ArsR family transcriptional regulator
MMRLDCILKALADPTRLRILALLHGRDELCVCEIVEALRLPQYAASRHLRELRAARLVAARRQGRWMHYRISRRLPQGDRGIADALCIRAKAEPIVRQDLRRLRCCLRPRAGRAGRVVASCRRKEAA